MTLPEPSLANWAAPCCTAGIVLLKNRRLGSGSPKTRLPLDASRLKRVVVLGPHANSSEMLFGNYYGNPAGHVITPFEAVKVGHACYTNGKWATVELRWLWHGWHVELKSRVLVPPSFVASCSCGC